MSSCSVLSISVSSAFSHCSIMYVYNAFASSFSITNSVLWSVEQTHLKSAMAETSVGYVTMASLGFSFEQPNKDIKQATIDDINRAKTILEIN